MRKQLILLYLLLAFVLVPRFIYVWAHPEMPALVYRPVYPPNVPGVIDFVYFNGTVTNGDCVDYDFDKHILVDSGAACGNSR